MKIVRKQDNQLEILPSCQILYDEGFLFIRKVYLKGQSPKHQRADTHTMGLTIGACISWNPVEKSVNFCSWDDKYMRTANAAQPVQSYGIRKGGCERMRIQHRGPVSVQLLLEWYDSVHLQLWKGALARKQRHIREKFSPSSRKGSGRSTKCKCCYWGNNLTRGGHLS